MLWVETIPRPRLRPYELSLRKSRSALALPGCSAAFVVAAASASTGAAPPRGWITLPAAGWPSGWAIWGGATLRGLALVLIVLALAGPRWPDLKTRIPTEGIAIMMVLDVSGSMSQNDFEWQGTTRTRLEAAKDAFRLFVNGGTDNGTTFDGRPTDLVGLVAFASRPERVCPPTLSHSVILKLLHAQEAVTVPTEDDTNMSDALVVALGRLERVNAKQKVIVLLSDGDYTPGEKHTISGWTPGGVARIAAEQKVRIYTIDADRTPEDARTERRKAIETMKELAETTGGQYFPAADSEGMLAAYQSIDKLEKTDITSFHYRRYHEAFPWLGAGAFGLLCLTLALEMTAWRKLP